MLRPKHTMHRYRRATNVQRAQFHTRLGHVSEAISHKIETAHVAYTGVPKTCAERVRSVFNAPVTRVELIPNV